GGAAGLLASRAPQLAARLPQLSPLGRTVAQEVVATPIYEALRAMAGQEPELAQSLATFGGAGAGALAAQRLFGARRLPVLGGAVAGAALGAQPFVDPERRLEETLAQALPLGGAVGLLSPLGRASQPPTPRPPAGETRLRLPERPPQPEGPAQLRLPFPDVPKLEPEVLRQEIVPSATAGPPLLRREIPRPEAPFQLNLDFGEQISNNPVAKAAGFIASGGSPRSLRPVHEVVGDKQSLPRNLFFTLPKRLREQLGEIDESIKQLNAHMERLLRQHNVDMPAQLPQQA